jgi:hypothetical protein
VYVSSNIRIWSVDHRPRLIRMFGHDNADLVPHPSRLVESHNATG